ncbi:hypothetical protein [uncultured Clostridium sp.]|uniref:hypothetical protein n=1 Tax=uncultured Clostridium sp. TaxID=59620 RepID=UPI002638E87B|nr:hypothetical protein [uncultured Clostridium sp.]
MKKQVWCKIIDTIVNDSKINKGLMFIPREDNYSFNDLINWAKQNYNGFDNMNINNEKQEITFTYSNPIFGSRYETLYFK